MKNVKYSLSNFPIYDFKSIENKIEEMASKGWLLEKMKGLFWKYKKIEPKKIKASVVYLSNTSDFDPELKDKEMTIEELALRDGWKVLDKRVQMQIFYNEEEKPIPMQTDDLVQIETIHKTMKKTIVPYYLYTLIICIAQSFIQVKQMNNDVVGYLSSSLSLALITMFIFLAISSIINVIYYFSWYRKSKIRIGDNQEILSIKRFRILEIFLVLCAVSIVYGFINYKRMNMFVPFIITTLAILFISKSTDLFREQMREEGTSSKKNKFFSSIFIVVLTLIFMVVGVISLVISAADGDDKVSKYIYRGKEFDLYEDSLPVNIEDYLDIDAKWSKRAEEQETFIISSREYSQDPLLTESKDLPSLDYHIIDIKIDIFYNFIKEKILNEDEDIVLDDGTIYYDSYVKIDDNRWSANEVYQFKSGDELTNKYLICWDSRIVEIRFSNEPTDEEIQYIVQKLRDI